MRAESTLAYPIGALMLERRRERLALRTESEETMGLILTLRGGWAVPEFILSGSMVDFAVPQRNLLVEVDGGYHLQRREKDARRDAWMRGLGFGVIRFTDRKTNRKPNVVARLLTEHRRSKASKDRFDEACERLRDRIGGEILRDNDGFIVGVGRKV